ncbi:unnamed protein product, partial [Adineta steineri]
MILQQQLLLLLFSIIHSTIANVETLHFESACLQQTNLVHLNLRCSQYEHIQIIRVIYGYTKQPLLDECHFSIYDCIQEGSSHNILSCNGKQTCLINLTKNEMLSSSITTPGVPNCPDFNYIQVNFGCIPDSKDICDSWKDEGSIIHLSHTYSKDRTYNRCHCKIRSSMTNGQVLLHAREINREHDLYKSFIYPKQLNLDCKQTTYLEIAISRYERKCIDMLPTNNIALFGSGSHNFTLSYVKNDPFSELFFYLELKASPMKKDHNVQIICNWARRKTTTIEPMTTAILSSTIPVRKKTKGTTISMENGVKSSRLDLIRHKPIIHNDVEDTTNIPDEEEEEEGEGEGTEEEPVEVEEEEDLTNSMSQDSLAHGEHDNNKNNNNNNNDNNNTNKIERPSSTTTTATTSKMSSKMSTIKSTANGNGLRSLALDEHIKLVKQKKEEAEVLRLQRFQEQLRKKEQKWQQQQLERVKKWLQLRNRDTDHRSQVEERRRKRDEEAKAKLDELLRREKEREQRVTNNLKTNIPHKPESVMSMSTDILSTRRAISATRLRPNQRGLHESSDENSNIVISSHQLNPIDELQNHQSSDESSGTPLSSARSQKRPLPTSYAYWLTTGDKNNNHNSANFMRSTFTATCHSRISRSVERCSRDCRAQDEVLNGDSQRRVPSTNRQHLNETIRRLAKPKTNAIMTQSIHIGAISSSTSSNGIPLSRSSHQLRLTTSSVATTSSNNRRHNPTRPATVPTSTNESRTSPTDDSSRSDHVSSNKHISHRSKNPPSTTKPSAIS